MNNKKKILPILFLALLGGFLLTACGAPEQGSAKAGSPLEALPPWIKPLTSTGLRADWSGDSQRLLFLDQLVGNVHEIALATGEVTPLTAHFTHEGFTRARYLANGDILLCGPSAVSEEQGSDSRWQSELWVLVYGSGQPAYPLGEPCFEGPAVSRQQMRIAWTLSDYPEKILFGRSEIWLGDIVYDQGGPRLLNRRKVLDRSAFHYMAFLETQDFRPPDDTELLFTAYGYKGGEVMTVNTLSGEWHNHSRNWAYDEAEGVFHDGRYAAVERELSTYTSVPKGDIDIWRLRLDGSHQYQQMTYFTDYPGYGASNPVISPDGRWMAFQLRIKGGDHGNGQGIFLFDLAHWQDMLQKKGRQAAP